jgi:hypothetical protein
MARAAKAKAWEELRQATLQARASGETFTDIATHAALSASGSSRSSKATSWVINETR